MVKILSTQHYSTIIIDVEYKHDFFKITYRENGDSPFLKEWEILDEDNEEVSNDELINWAKKYIELVK